jgi:hypothetical protein
VSITDTSLAAGVLALSASTDFDVVPGDPATYDLGSALVPWAEVHAVDASVTDDLSVGDAITAVTVDASTSLAADVIAEHTAGSGVTIDGVLVKDNGLTATGAISAPTGSLILPQSATPTPTAEGSIAWDTDGDNIVVGDGAATLVFPPPLAGTWDPGLTFATPGDVNVVLSTHTGWWRKNGSVVTAGFELVTSTFTHTTASGNLKITGLPFNIVDIAHGSIVASGWTAAAVVQLTIHGPAGQTFLWVATMFSGSPSSYLGPTLMPTGGTVALRGIATYHV